MLILGGRYGSIDPQKGVSYTELEYDYAVETGKPYGKRNWRVGFRRKS